MTDEENVVEAEGDEIVVTSPLPSEIVVGAVM